MYNGTQVTPYVKRSSAHFYVGERTEYELERFANRRARCPSTAYSFWPGVLDEMRISGSVRSADWIANQYNKQASSGEFVGNPALQRGD